MEENPLLNDHLDEKIDKLEGLQRADGIALIIDQWREINILKVDHPLMVARLAYGPPGQYSWTRARNAELLAWLNSLDIDAINIAIENADRLGEACDESIVERHEFDTRSALADAHLRYRPYQNKWKVRPHAVTESSLPTL